MSSAAVVFGALKVKYATALWTGMDFASSTRAAENRTRWGGAVANSSVEPRRLSKVMG